MTDDSKGQGEEQQGRYFVQSLERGLAVIRAFDAESPVLSPSDVARKAGLTRSAARRFLLTLADLGYVKTDGRVFRLTPRVLELGYAFLSSMRLPDIALARLEELVAEVGEASEVAILDGTDIVYVLRVPGPRMLTVSVNVGERKPAFATSLGRVLLSGLTEEQLDSYFASAHFEQLLPSTLTDPDSLRDEIRRVREDGYAIVDQQLEEGLCAIAVPIRNGQGEVVAAANLSTITARRSIDSLRDELRPPLIAAVQQIEVELRMASGGSG